MMARGTASACARPEDGVDFGSRVLGIPPRAATSSSCATGRRRAAWRGAYCVEAMTALQWITVVVLMLCAAAFALLIDRWRRDRHTPSPPPEGLSPYVPATQAATVDQTRVVLARIEEADAAWKRAHQGYETRALLAAAVARDIAVAAQTTANALRDLEAIGGSVRPGRSLLSELAAAGRAARRQRRRPAPRPRPLATRRPRCGRAVGHRQHARRAVAHADRRLRRARKGGRRSRRPAGAARRRADRPGRPPGRVLVLRPAEHAGETNDRRPRDQHLQRCVEICVEIIEDPDQT